jgi:predicted dehydrogenase
MTANADQAVALHRDVADSGLTFAVAHCYTGYPMVREARELVASGALGTIRMIEAEHAAGGPDMVASLPTRRLAIGVSVSRRWVRRVCWARSARTRTI